MSEKMPANYAQRVGERLRVIRKQKGLSLQDVEASSAQEFKASVLGAYERGERAISVPRLQRLARFYGVPVDQLLPKDADSYGRPVDDAEDELIDLAAANGARPQPVNGRFDEDKVSIDLTRLDSIDTDQRELLSRYLGMIQLQRQDFNGKVLTIRAEDLRAIACLFDTTALDMRRRLDELGLRR